MNSVKTDVKREEISRTVGCAIPKSPKKYLKLKHDYDMMHRLLLCESDHYLMLKHEMDDEKRKSKEYYNQICRLSWAINDLKCLSGLKRCKCAVCKLKIEKAEILKRKQNG